MNLNDKNDDNYNHIIIIITIIMIIIPAIIALKRTFIFDKPTYKQSNHPKILLYKRFVLALQYKPYVLLKLSGSIQTVCIVMVPANFKKLAKLEKV